jgi:hypothetical protein
LVVAIGSPFKDGSPVVSLAGLSFSGAHDYIEAVGLINFESELVYLLVDIGAVDDHVVAVEAIVLDLVAQNSLERLYVEGFGASFDDVGDIGVGLAWANEAKSTLRRIIGCAHHIGHSSSGGSSLTNNPRMGSNARESVNVNTKLPEHVSVC